MTEKHFTLSEATDLAARALTASGAGRGPAESVARAVVAAEARGRSNVGFQHLPYYCDALLRGAVDGRVEPALSRSRPGRLSVDARSGFTHYAFDRALETFEDMVRNNGVAVLTIRDTYTCGELGYFPERLARHGFVAIAATNAGPAAVAPSGAGQAIFSTNPLAYAFPRDNAPPLLVDQSSSACTLVDVRAARERGEKIPDDWALDDGGRSTNDPRAALSGSFKPFGGYKGSNIALLVELLAAGLSGGNWSLDAPSFADDTACPDVGQWFLAMDSASSGKRIDQYLDRIAGLDAHVPGREREMRLERAGEDGLTLPAEVVDNITAYCDTE